MYHGIARPQLIQRQAMHHHVNASFQNANDEQFRTTRSQTTFEAIVFYVKIITSSATSAQNESFIASTFSFSTAQAQEESSSDSSRQPSGFRIGIQSLAPKPQFHGFQLIKIVILERTGNDVSPRNVEEMWAW